MIPSYSTASSDNESLQADVMRFMAIIAFCLIAILALVKEVEPPIPAAEQQPKTPPAPSAEPSLAKDTVKTKQLTPPPAWQAPIRKPTAAAVQTAPTEKATPEQPRLAVSAVTLAEPAQADAAQTESSSPEQSETAEEGLSLRFASPGDFLRLIARGDIKVYAFNNLGDVLGLNLSYEFLSAHTPGKVYELLPQTIPSLIVDSLVRSRRERGDDDSFTWGITLPQAIEAKIAVYLASAESGQLVIDRYGEVHHVAHN